MKRVKAFFAYEAITWMSRAGRGDISVGEAAYALRQADMRMRMRQHCIEMWALVPSWIAMGTVPKSNRGRPHRPRPGDAGYVYGAA